MTRELRFLDNEPFCDHNFDKILIFSIPSGKRDWSDWNWGRGGRQIILGKERSGWTMNEIRNYRIFLYIKVPLQFRENFDNIQLFEIEWRKEGGCFLATRRRNKNEAYENMPVVRCKPHSCSFFFFCTPSSLYGFC